MDSGRLVVDRKSRTANLYAVGPFALAGIACVVPYLLAHAPQIGFALQRAFALVCHQQPERSFMLFGGTIAVCARCLGIYLGAALGLLVRVSRRVTMRFLLVAVAVNAADSFAEIAGAHDNWMVVRFVLGIVLGTAAAMLVAASSEKPSAPTSNFGRTVATTSLQ